MQKKFFEDKRPHKGLTYIQYLNMTVEELSETNIDSLPEKEKGLFEYTKLNLKRSNRIDKTYKVSEKLSELVKKIDEPQLWMMITENWCGDSAQVLPAIAKIAAENDKIDFRIILRDENPDIIDEYLTNGTRGIPKLVAFDEKGNELFTWGPRTKAAQDLINELKSNNTPKQEMYQQLHLWYAKDKLNAVESEFMEILEEVLAGV